ncbi:YlzJ-like family protein [Alkalibacillus haloalkaliphilus]|uniref:YlzJ-like family protein n=1 Tax=Alkalibacillus haloalkaliphilus TaxID=94136 RepID=UPI0002EFE32F|nr:YlzJ-like family protein [Alkalibacillus haloalkaliphilus]MDV2580659.1 YlzJ-like family protein [Alkalibacillus haloalkaliphilus]
MIIYTPLLEQEIFEDEEQHESFHWLNVNHATVKLRRDVENNSFEIVHMTSTNPSDYLQKHLQPGSIYYL